MTSLDTTAGISIELPQLFKERMIAGCSVASDLLFKPEREHLRAYLGWIVRNADAKGQFSRSSRLLQNLPDDDLVRDLIKQGYNALVYHSADDVLGHVAFQVHGDAIHMFSVGVAPFARNQGFGRSMVLDLIEWGRARPEITQIILGAGGHPFAQRICESFGQYVSELNLQREGECHFRYLK